MARESLVGTYIPRTLLAPLKLGHSGGNWKKDTKYGFRESAALSWKWAVVGALTPRKLAAEQGLFCASSKEFSEPPARVQGKLALRAKERGNVPSIQQLLLPKQLLLQKAGDTALWEVMLCWPSGQL